MIGTSSGRFIRSCDQGVIDGRKSTKVGGHSPPYFFLPPLNYELYYYS